MESVRKQQASSLGTASSYRDPLITTRFAQNISDSSGLMISVL